MNKKSFFSAQFLCNFLHMAWRTLEKLLFHYFAIIQKFMMNFLIFLTRSKLTLNGEMVRAEAFKRRASEASTVINWEQEKQNHFFSSYFAIKFMSRRIMGTINQRLGNLIFLLLGHLRHNLTHHHELELQTSLTFLKRVINKLAFLTVFCGSASSSWFSFSTREKGEGRGRRRTSRGKLLYKIKLLLRGNYEGGHFISARTS